MERMTRIELAQPAWEAGVLPLNYTRTVIQPIYYITKAVFLQGGKREFFVTSSERRAEFRHVFPISAGEEGVLKLFVFALGNGDRAEVILP